MGSDIKNLNMRKIKVEEVFYYLFFGIMFAAKGVGLDSGQRLFSFCALVAICCLAVKLCLTKYTLKEWTVMIILILLGIGMYYSSGESAALWAMFVIVGMKNIPIKRLLKVCAGIWSITFVLSVTAGILHIRDGVVVVHEKLGLGPIIRWSLGYTHPNVLHVSYFILIVLLVYIFDWHGKKLWKASAFFFVGNLLIFLYSVSYTGILIVSFYLALNLYLDWRKKLLLSERVLMVVAAGVLILFPIVGPLWLEGHNHSLFMYFNELLSYRFELVYNIFHENPISLLGTKTVFTGNGHLSLDSSYAYLLMYYGIIGFTLFVAGILYLVYRFAQKNRKKELAITLAIVLAGVTEQFLFNLSFKNLLLFFLGEMLFSEVLKTRRKAVFWNRLFALIPIGEKELCITLSNGWISGLKNVGKHSKQIVFAGILCAVCGLLIYTAAVKKPDSVYVNRWSTDYRGTEIVELDVDNLPEDFNSLVIGYQGMDTEMFELTGNIVTLEHIRTCIGGGILGGLAGVFLAAVFWTGRGWREGINRQ